MEVIKILENDIIDILKESGVLMEGHFELTSGRHSDKYMQCAKVFRFPEYTSSLARALAEKIADKKISKVIGPAIGGIILAYEVSKALNVTNIFAEREDGKMVFRRGFEVLEGERILIVEDVVTTGGSVKEVIELVKEKGGIPVAVASIVDRSNGNVDFGITYKSLLSIDVLSYEADDCPLCKDNIPLIKPGSRNI